MDHQSQSHPISFSISLPTLPLFYSPNASLLSYNSKKKMVTKRKTGKSKVLVYLIWCKVFLYCVSFQVFKLFISSSSPLLCVCFFVWELVLNRCYDKRMFLEFDSKAVLICCFSNCVSLYFLLRSVCVYNKLL